jgi:hypothetical protein
MQVLIALVVACLLPGIPQSNHAPSAGILDGHLHIVSSQPVEPEGGAMPTVTRATYAEFPLVVLVQDGRKAVAEVTADEHGNFRLELPPGRYVLDVKDRRWKHIRGKAQPFTIRLGETTHVTFEMDTGVRASP